MIQQTALVLKAMGEPTRLTIIKFLSVQELCICELTAILNMSQPRISQQVKVLKQAGLVKERKFRQKSFFSINPGVLNGILIEPFKSFVQSDLSSIAEIAEEYRRYEALEGDETIKSCKNGCLVKDIEQKQKVS